MIKRNGFAAFVILMFSPGFERPETRMFFLALLVPLVVVRVFTVLSHLVCAPDAAPLRLLPMSDSAALLTHKIILLIVSYVSFVIMFLAFISQMGMPDDTNILVQMIAGTLLVFVLSLIVIGVRKRVAESILSGAVERDGRSWVKIRLASFWHVFALCYLFVVWLI